ncbi:DUF2934 domain-containing protein [Lichenifustis flavocetrariae]|uniref:DUF2934 domain-containing protein n=1 Tax=Lichenifustis flavocetrariae TaxID=2949735 RepID=UPI003D120DCA
MSSTKDHDDQESIRHQAYLIWLDEGQPEGRSEEHWRLAREMNSVDLSKHEPSQLDQSCAGSSKTAS